MRDTKTKPALASVSEYLDAISDNGRRADCDFLVDLMSRLTGEPPVLWGPSIVGFGTYRYRNASGHQGASCRAGFSSRKSDISIYLVASGPDQEELLTRLGKHKMGKACLRIRHLADIDLGVLEQLIAASISEVHRRYD